MTTTGHVAVQTSGPTRLMDRLPIYYGWIVWAAGTLGLIATSPGQSYSVSLFFDHFVADFGLSRTVVSGLYGAGTLVGAVTLTFIGRAIDRYGNRRMGLVISVIFALVLAAFSLVTGPFTLLLGFAAIRMLGQGALSLNSSTAIVGWFQRKRGMVMGLTMFVFLVGQGLYVLGVSALIQTVGWRRAWVVLAIGVALTMLPVTRLLTRGRPEDFGLVVDGGPPGTGGQGVLRRLFLRNPSQEEENWTLAQAIRTPIYWVIMLAGTLNGAWITALFVHQQSVFGVLGHPPQVAVQTLALISTVAAVTTLFVGPAINRVRPGLMIAFEMGLMVLGLSVAIVMTPRWATVIFAVAIGVAMGIMLVFNRVVSPNLFGRLHQGAILGPITSSTVFGASAGPLIFSLSYDRVGDYSLSLIFAAALAAAVMVAGLFIRKPPAPPDLQPETGS